MSCLEANGDRWLPSILFISNLPLMTGGSTTPTCSQNSPVQMADYSPRIAELILHQARDRLTLMYVLVFTIPSSRRLISLQLRRAYPRSSSTPPMSSSPFITPHLVCTTKSIWTSDLSVDSITASPIGPSGWTKPQTINYRDIQLHAFHHLLEPRVSRLV